MATLIDDEITQNLLSRTRRVS